MAGGKEPGMQGQAMVSTGQVSSRCRHMRWQLQCGASSAMAGGHAGNACSSEAVGTLAQRRM